MIPPGNPRSHAAYVIETGCRMLATLESGTLLSKPAAVRWGSMALPKPWAGLAQRVPEWKKDGIFDAELNVQAQAFILWAAQQADVA
ncbi:aminoglycoside adenylyltransferase domain-containing protein [Deinococcus malanensis]|uniref:aminoglycoside adenylyltransferase domain-containing protein n=1 Tax=Deinococcus malanensis TaxID=1706855 RepID=UPI00363DF04D